MLFPSEVEKDTLNSIDSGDDAHPQGPEQFQRLEKASFPTSMATPLKAHCRMSRTANGNPAAAQLLADNFSRYSC